MATPSSTGRPRRGRHCSRALVAAVALAACAALPAAAAASNDDVRVRFTGAMVNYGEPNAQPSDDLVVSITKTSWDLVWDGTRGELDASALGQPTVLLAKGQRLLTFTDRNPCRIAMSYVELNGPYVLVARREANMDVASISTMWGGNFIESEPRGACSSNAGGYAILTLAGHATWTPQSPLLTPTADVESQGLEHLASAAFRFNRDTPEMRTSFRFDYSLPPGAASPADPARRRVLWFGQVSIQSDPPKKLPAPIDLMKSLPGSDGNTVPGDVPNPAAVAGDSLSIVANTLADSVYASFMAPNARGDAGRRAALAAATTARVPLAPPEGWTQGGTLVARVCPLARPAPGRACGVAQRAAGGSAVVRGATVHLPGDPAAKAARPNAPLVVRLAPGGRAALRATSTKLLLVDLTFTPTTGPKVVYRRAVPVASLR